MKNDTKTTVFGAIIAAVIAANVNYNALLQGDLTEAGKVIAAVATACLAYFTNKTQ